MAVACQAIFMLDYSIRAAFYLLALGLLMAHNSLLSAHLYIQLIIQLHYFLPLATTIAFLKHITLAKFLQPGLSYSQAV